LVFIEVKYRKSDRRGLPMEAVSFYKQKTICRVSDYYRMENGLGEEQGIRFDVISVEGEDITWIPNAFDYIP
ncbi:MAG: YraN family protein, partial [Lachnospiraceae bacterium]|nr:YraN family protein [Lachnospiraceae bacterium]